MIKKGFQNVRRMSGPGSGDRGRDIHAEEPLSSVTGIIIPSKILVQCKNYAPSKTTITPGFVESLANRAITLGYNRIFIITSHELSSQAKITASEMIDSQRKILAEWWTGHDLTTLLVNNPRISRRFSLSKIASSRLNIAILDGYARSRGKEKPCVPAFSDVTAKDWGVLLQNDDSSISFITASEIDSSFDAVLNPFGETYPEEDYQSKATYLRILNYLSNGGLFVNVSGFPFFYYWDHDRGQNIAIAPTRYVLDPRLRQITGFWNFNETVLYRDFHTTLDSRSPTEVIISQEEEDKAYVGDLLKLNIDRVTQFRAVNSSNTHAIPLLRAEESKIYPLSAIKYGNGHLMIAGLELHSKEAPLISSALINWLLTNGGELSLENKK